MVLILCMVPEIWSAKDRIFLSFWTIFCPFNPLWTQKIKLLKKWITLEDIILQMMQLMTALLSRTTIMQGKWD